MFVELLEQLRCPNAHEETPLIASAVRTDARHIVRGLLGCPVCRAEFPIVDGVARFAAAPDRGDTPEAPSAEIAMRIAAFLELTDARGFALLAGRWGAHADQIRRVSETPLVAVNPPAAVEAEVAAVMIVADTLPLAAGSARAAALDEGMTQRLADSVVRAVRAGGRVMGPATIPLPAGLIELVRDDRVWVAEKSAASHATPRLTPLERARR